MVEIGYRFNVFFNIHFQNYTDINFGIHFEKIVNNSTFRLGESSKFDPSSGVIGRIYLISQDYFLKGYRALI